MVEIHLGEFKAFVRLAKSLGVELLHQKLLGVKCAFNKSALFRGLALSFEISVLKNAGKLCF